MPPTIPSRHVHRRSSCASNISRREAKHLKQPRRSKPTRTRPATAVVLAVCEVPQVEQSRYEEVCPSKNWQQTKTYRVARRPKRHIFEIQEDEVQDDEHLTDEPQRKSFKRALAIQYSPGIPKAKRVRVQSPKVLRFSVRKEQVITHAEEKPVGSPSSIPFTPQINEAAHTSSDGAHPYDVYYFNAWLAHLVLTYAVRVPDAQKPFSNIPFSAIDALARRIFDFFSHGVHFGEDKTILAMWYIHLLSPEGFVDIEDLATEEGVQAAMRLFLLGYNFALKWQEDLVYVSIATWAPHYGQGFTKSSVLALEMAGLEALDHSLYLAPRQWMDFLLSLSRWSWNVLDSYRNPIPASHFMLAERLEELGKKDFMRGTTAMCGRRTIPPSSSALHKVHHNLLVGLDALIVRLAPVIYDPAPATEWCPAADEVVQSYGRNRTVYGRN